MLINIILKVFILITIIIERERNLLHLPEAVDDIDVNRLLVGRCRCIVGKATQLCPFWPRRIIPFG